MSTDVLRVSGDYIVDASNGNITFNVTNSVSTGTVFINGNLTVLGTQTNIASVDSEIRDNIIVLNSGEVNNYVTKGTSGIMIARGNNDSATNAASLLYSDADTWTTVKSIGTGTSLTSTSTQGVFNFQSAQAGSAIRVNAIRIYETTATAISGRSRLNILGAENANSIISVSGTNNYELNLSDDDDIPNKRYVDQRFYAGTNVAKSVIVGNSFLKVLDPADLTDSGAYYAGTSQLVVALGTSTNVVFKLIGETALFSGITLSSATISVNNVGQDLVLQPAPNQAVVVESPLRLQKVTTATVATLNQNTIYYDTPGGGGSGIYYVNTSQHDELVSRRRAIIYGIIF